MSAAYHRTVDEVYQSLSFPFSKCVYLATSASASRPAPSNPSTTPRPVYPATGRVRTLPFFLRCQFLSPGPGTLSPAIASCSLLRRNLAALKDNGRPFARWVQGYAQGTRFTLLLAYHLHVLLAQAHHNF